MESSSPLELSKSPVSGLPTMLLPFLLACGMGKARRGALCWGGWGAYLLCAQLGILAGKTQGIRGISQRADPSTWQDHRTRAAAWLQMTTLVSRALLHTLATHNC